jgi:hexosaminidase
MCVLLMSAASNALSVPAQRPPISVVPRPAKMEPGEGLFQIEAQTAIVLDKNSEALGDVADYLAERLRESTGFLLPVSQSGVQGHAVVFTLRESGTDADTEAYSLTVSPRQVQITSSRPAGAFYAVQSLIQLLPAEVEYRAAVHGLRWTVPCIRIEDRPRFSWRGMHLDVGRHFAPKQFVKKYIDLLAAYKFNRFHWHLTEDQGWRLEIKRYPRLTTVGSWRSETLGDGMPYGGFYTQNDVREIVEYARKRFITVIPEIEMPGHSVAALAAYPELSCTGGPFEVRTKWGVSRDVYCAGNEQTFVFLRNVLSEVFSLFPGAFVHIGGDECPKARWLACPRCRARMDEEGITTGEELQSYFIRRIGKFLQDHGKRLIGWDEILEGGLGPNAIVMSWRGIQGGIDAAKAGHEVIMTPTSTCYFDYRQGLTGEPTPVGDYLPLDSVYAYDPIPDSLTQEEAAHILGAQGNVWTEWMTDTKYMEYMAFPRACALSEVVWSPAGARNFRDFSERMASQYAHLLASGINVRIPPPGGFEGDHAVLRDTTVSLINPVPGAIVRYTLDGTEPTEASPVPPGSIRIDTDVVLKARTYLPGGVASHVATGYFSRIDTSIDGLYVKEYINTEKGGTKEDTSAWPAHVYRVSLEEIPVGNDVQEILFSGFLAVPREGLYSLFLNSPMLATLTIDSLNLLSDSLTFGPDPSRIFLNRGSHEFRLLLKKRSPRAWLVLEMEGPGLERRPIPPSMLRRVPE